MDVASGYAIHNSLEQRTVYCTQVEKGTRDHPFARDSEWAPVTVLYEP